MKYIFKIITQTLLLSIFTLNCSSTQQFDFYNPFPDKTLILEKRNTACADSYETKLWYILYGNYPLNHLNLKEIFPTDEYTYKIEQKATVGDKILSVFTGLFLTISRKTLVVQTCQPVANLDKNQRNMHSDVKMEELEKEVSYMKGKISGIESTLGWINPASAQSSTLPNADTRLMEMNPKEISHFHFLFSPGSASINKTESEKLKSVSENITKAKSKIIIIGSTDKTGSFKYNLSLSLERALAVKKALLKSGIQSENIEISGAGEFSSNKNNSASEFSRRVDVYVVRVE